MKIGVNFINYNFLGNNKPEVSVSSENKNSEAHFDCASSDCISQMGKAQVSIQAHKKIKTDEEIIDVINGIIQPRGMKIKDYFGSSMIQIGRPIEECPDLCYDDIKAKCVFDDENCLKEIYFKNLLDSTIEVYDADGKLKTLYNKADFKALKEYKYHPEAIHRYLRFNVESKLPPQAEVLAMISSLDEIFENKSPELNEKKVVYRALQDNLTDGQIDSLSCIGGVFMDPSYVSTTQKLSTAKRFQYCNPILEIELPKGTKYLDLDLLFNIDHTRWQEQEFLLPRNALFEVQGFDSDNNIIKVKYLGSGNC